MKKGVLTFLIVSSMLAIGMPMTADDAKPTKETRIQDKVKQELMEREKQWARAIVTNDAEAIGRFMSDDWCLIHQDGSLMQKSTFLGVESGEVTHGLMEFDDWRVSTALPSIRLPDAELSLGCGEIQSYPVELNSPVEVTAMAVRIDYPVDLSNIVEILPGPDLPADLDFFRMSTGGGTSAPGQVLAEFALLAGDTLGPGEGLKVLELRIQAKKRQKYSPRS